MILIFSAKVLWYSVHIILLNYDGRSLQDIISIKSQGKWYIFKISGMYLEIPEPPHDIKQ